MLMLDKYVLQMGGLRVSLTLGSLVILIPLCSRSWEQNLKSFVAALLVLSISANCLESFWK